MLEHNKKKHEERKELEDNWFFKSIELLDYPFDILRKLTIPPCNED